MKKAKESRLLAIGAIPTLALILALCGQCIAAAEVEPNNELGDATEIEAGQTASGSIFPASDWDVYKVLLNSTGILQAKVISPPEEMKAKIDLYGKSFNWITRKDAENPGDDVLLTVDVSVPGWYYLGVADLVGGSSNTTYTFAVDFEPIIDQEPNGELGDAFEIQPGQPIKGYIFPAGDWDVYKVFLNSSGILEASLEDVPKAIIASMRGKIDLYGKSCNWILRKDAEKPADNLSLTYDIASPGWYYLGVADLNGGSYNKTYTFKTVFKPVIDAEPNGELGDATLIQLGQSGKGYIFPAGDWDVYKVYVPSAGPLEAKLENVPKSIKASMKGKIDMYGKSGGWIVRKDAEKPGDDVTLKFDIDKPGWYYFGIADLNGGSYGTEYTFRVGS